METANTDIETLAALRYAGSRPALTDALNIDTVNPYAELNMSQHRLISGTTSKMPDGCGVGIREFYYYNVNWFVIKITELSPVLGRTWYNRYDKVANVWSGWKSITPQ